MKMKVIYDFIEKRASYIYEAWKANPEGALWLNILGFLIGLLIGVLIS